MKQNGKEINQKENVFGDSETHTTRLMRSIGAINGANGGLDDQSVDFDKNE